MAVGSREGQEGSKQEKDSLNRGWFAEAGAHVRKNVGGLWQQEWSLDDSRKDTGTSDPEELQRTGLYQQPG